VKFEESRIEFISKYFKYKNTPPKWLGEEIWLYFDGIPMTFVGQKNEFSNNVLRVAYEFEFIPNDCANEKITKYCYQEVDEDGIAWTSFQ